MPAKVTYGKGRIRVNSTQVGVAPRRRWDIIEAVIAGIAILFAIIGLVMLICRPTPASAQESVEPAVTWEITNELGTPIGFGALCAGIQLTVYAATPSDVWYEARCGSEANPAERFYALFGCGVSTGVVQAWEHQSAYLGFTEVVTTIPCDAGTFELEQQMCKNPLAGRLHINLPTYWGASSSQVFCREAKF